MLKYGTEFGKTYIRFSRHYNKVEYLGAPGINLENIFGVILESRQNGKMDIIEQLSEKEQLLFPGQRPLHLKRCKHFRPGFIIEKIYKKSEQTKYDLFIFHGSWEGKLNFDPCKKIKNAASVSFDFFDLKTPKYNSK